MRNRCQREWHCRVHGVHLHHDTKSGAEVKQMGVLATVIVLCIGDSGENCRNGVLERKQRHLHQWRLVEICMEAIEQLRLFYDGRLVISILLAVRDLVFCKKQDITWNYPQPKNESLRSLPRTPNVNCISPPVCPAIGIRNRPNQYQYLKIATNEATAAPNHKPDA